MMATGMRAKEVGAALGISQFTVQTHVRNMYEKLGCRNLASVIYTVLTKNTLAAVEGFCNANHCEMLHWIDISEASQLNYPSRVLLDYETAVVEATNVGNSVFIGNGQIMPKPLRVAAYPKGFKATGETVPSEERKASGQ